MGEMMPANENGSDNNNYATKYAEVEQQFVDGLVTKPEMERLQKEIADEYYQAQKQKNVDIGQA